MQLYFLSSRSPNISQGKSHLVNLQQLQKGSVPQEESHCEISPFLFPLAIPPTHSLLSHLNRASGILPTPSSALLKCGFLKLPDPLPNAPSHAAPSPAPHSVELPCCSEDNTTVSSSVAQTPRETLKTNNTGGQTASGSFLHSC